MLRQSKKMYQIGQIIVVAVTAMLVSISFAAAYDGCDAYYRRCAMSVGVRQQGSEARIRAVCGPKLTSCKRSHQWRMQGGGYVAVH
jgi:hypothetical protein